MSPKQKGEKRQLIVETVDSDDGVEDAYVEEVEDEGEIPNFGKSGAPATAAAANNNANPTPPAATDPKGDSTESEDDMPSLIDDDLPSLASDADSSSGGGGTSSDSDEDSLPELVDADDGIDGLKLGGETSGGRASGLRSGFLNRPQSSAAQAPSGLRPGFLNPAQPPPPPPQQETAPKKPPPPKPKKKAAAARAGGGASSNRAPPYLPRINQFTQSSPTMQAMLDRVAASGDFSAMATMLDAMERDDYGTFQRVMVETLEAIDRKEAANAASVPEHSKRKQKPKPQERVQYELFDSEEIRRMQQQEEEKRQALRKAMGLVEDAEETEDAELGKCPLGGACTRDPESHAVRESHSDRIHLQCSQGCDLWFHVPCWRKFGFTMDGTAMTGREFKWGAAKNANLPCFKEGCVGHLVYAMGPHKYLYLDRREGEKKHPAREAAVEAARREKLHRWTAKPHDRKGGKGKKGGRDAGGTAGEYEEEIEVVDTGEEEMDGEEEGEVEVEESEGQPGGQLAPTPLAPEPEPEVFIPLPDDSELKQLRRGSDDEDMLRAHKPSRKDKGKAPAVAPIVYDDDHGGGEGAKKKNRGVTLHWAELAGNKASLAEQRRREAVGALDVGGDEAGSSGAGEEAEEAGGGGHQQRAPHFVGRSSRTSTASSASGPALPSSDLTPMNFPTLGSSTGAPIEWHSGAGPLPTTIGSHGRSKLADAMLTVLRNLTADPDQETSVVLIEEINYKGIRTAEAIGAPRFLRNYLRNKTGCEVVELELFEECSAAAAQFEDHGAAISAMMLLTSKVLHNRKLQLAPLRRLPTKAEVHAAAERMLKGGRAEAEEAPAARAAPSRAKVTAAVPIRQPGRPSSEADYFLPNSLGSPTFTSPALKPHAAPFIPGGFDGSDGTGGGQISRAKADAGAAARQAHEEQQRRVREVQERHDAEMARKLQEDLAREEARMALLELEDSLLAKDLNANAGRGLGGASAAPGSFAATAAAPPKPAPAPVLGLPGQSVPGPNMLSMLLPGYLPPMLGGTGGGSGAGGALAPASGPGPGPGPGMAPVAAPAPGMLPMPSGHAPVPAHVPALPQSRTEPYRPAYRPPGAYNPQGPGNAPQTVNTAPPPNPGAVGMAPQAAPRPPAQMQHSCLWCGEREALHVWIPCGHRGHCAECLPGTDQNQKTAQFPNCGVCGKPAQRYIRYFKA